MHIKNEGIDAGKQVNDIQKFAENYLELNIKIVRSYRKICPPGQT